MPSDAGAFKSLTAQVTHRIGLEIDAGTWVDWLPGERALTGTLHVSRKTIRKALVQLQRDGRIATQHGQGHRIVAPVIPPRNASNSVGLLTLESLENLRPYTALWVDELRALLFDNRRTLALFSGHRFFSSRADTELARLVRQNPQACWVLAHTDERIQQWFHTQGVPTPSVLRWRECPASWPAPVTVACCYPVRISTILRSAGMRSAPCRRQAAIVTSIAAMTSGCAI